MDMEEAEKDFLPTDRLQKNEQSPTSPKNFSSASPGDRVELQLSPAGRYSSWFLLAVHPLTTTALTATWLLLLLLRCPSEFGGGGGRDLVLVQLVRGVQPVAAAPGWMGSARGRGTKLLLHELSQLLMAQAKEVWLVLIQGTSWSHDIGQCCPQWWMEEQEGGCQLDAA